MRYFVRFSKHSIKFLMFHVETFHGVSSFLDIFISNYQQFCSTFCNCFQLNFYLDTFPFHCFLFLALLLNTRSSSLHMAFHLWDKFSCYGRFYLLSLFHYYTMLYSPCTFSIALILPLTRILLDLPHLNTVWDTNFISSCRQIDAMCVYLNFYLCYSTMFFHAFTIFCNCQQFRTECIFDHLFHLLLKILYSPTSPSRDFECSSF